MNLDANAKYQDTHEWARKDGDLIVCGITDHAQDELSDVVYVELPETGIEYEKGDIFGTVESVKAASELYMPMAGKIVEVNALLEDEPELVNTGPFSEGWMIKFKPTGDVEDQWEALLTGEAYQQLLESEEE